MLLYTSNNSVQLIPRSALSDSEPLLKVKHQHPLQLGDRPISRSFDIIVRRKNYKSFPIQWIDAEGTFFLEQDFIEFLLETEIEYPELNWFKIRSTEEAA